MSRARTRGNDRTAQPPPAPDGWRQGPGTALGLLGQAVMQRGRTVSRLMSGPPARRRDRHGDWCRWASSMGIDGHPRPVVDVIVVGE